MSPQMLPIADSAAALLDKATRCRRLARQSTDGRAIETLSALAADCETRAAQLLAVLKRAVG